MTLPIIKKPWYWSETDFVPQLKLELAVGHSLASKKIKSIGRRQDDDIFLFEIEENNYKYVIAHLWMGLQSSPPLQFFKDWDDIYINRISIDEQDWEDMESRGL